MRKAGTASACRLPNPVRRIANHPDCPHPSPGVYNPKQRRVVMVGPDMNAMGGMASVVATYRDSGFLDRWSVIFLTTYVEGPAWRRLAAGIRALLCFLMILMRGKVAFVHIHVAQRVSFLRKSLFVLAARAFRRPVVLHVHGAQFDRFYEDSSSMYRRYIDWILDCCTWIITLSDQWLAWFRAHTRNENIIRVYNPVILSDTRPDRGEAPPRNPPTVVFLGRIGQRKGAYDLLHAMANVVAARVPGHLHLCGDGEVEQARQVARDLGIEQHVTIPGWVGADERRRLLGSARVFVLPSYHEGLPVSILEAMSAGVPVVSSPVGGIPDAISDGVEGLLVPPGNPDELAAALMKILADEHLGRAMGAAGKLKVASTFAAGTALKPLDRLYGLLT